MLSVTTKSGIYNGYKVIGTQTLGLRGLVLWLKFNEGSGSTAYDSSFYNNHGTIYGATWTDGKFGKAPYYDGIDDYGEISDSKSIQPGTSDYTISLWVYSYGHPSNYCGILYKGNGDWGTKDGWLIRYYSWGEVRFHMGDGTNNLGAVGVAEELPVKKWTHLAVVLDRDVGYFGYMNGNLTDSTTIDTSSNYVGGPDLHIAKDWSWSDFFFNGIIDNVMIFKRALSQEEIKMLIYNRIGAIPSKTI